MDDLDPQSREVFNDAVRIAQAMADGQLKPGRREIFLPACKEAILAMIQAGQLDPERLALYGFSKGIEALR